MTLLQPNDAIYDNSTGAYVGELIPIRLYLRDLENDNLISDAILSYNWTTGIRYFAESVSGIYEVIIDTTDLGAFGEYYMVINSSKIGFSRSQFTLIINLGEQSRIQRLESDSKIVINSNSTIKFRYYSDVDGEGIQNAIITLAIQFIIQSIN
jgi:hypothetical protein